MKLKNHLNVREKRREQPRNSEPISRTELKVCRRDVYLHNMPGGKAAVLAAC